MGPNKWHDVLVVNGEVFVDLEIMVQFKGKIITGCSHGKQLTEDEVIQEYNKNNQRRVER